MTRHCDETGILVHQVKFGNRKRRLSRVLDVSLRLREEQTSIQIVHQGVASGLRQRGDFMSIVGMVYTNANRRT
jgi:hypothetical protein